VKNWTMWRFAAAAATTGFWVQERRIHDLLLSLNDRPQDRWAELTIEIREPKNQLKQGGDSGSDG
jgi:hypothetical protein